MAVNLSPVGGVAAQFFTNTGAVLTGGKIYTYAAGTTTPATTFTSSQGNVAWTNPIVLDAAGRVSGSGEIWLTDGINYKFVLKDSNDVLIATYDNISGINSNFISFTNQQQIVTATAGQTVFNLSISYQPGTNSLSVFVDGVNQYGPGAQYAYTETDSDTVTFTSGLHVGAVVKFTTTQQQAAGAVNASQVSYTPTGTGAVATNVAAWLDQFVTVNDFGADNTGVTAMDSALAAALVASRFVIIPYGNYKLTGYVEIPSNTTLLILGNVNCYNRQAGLFTLNASNVTIDGMGVGKLYDSAVQANYVWNSVNTPGQPYTPVIHIRKASVNCNVRNLRINYTCIGVWMSNADANYFPTGVVTISGTGPSECGASNIYATYLEGAGIQGTSGTRLEFSNSYVYRCGDGGLWMMGCYESDILNNVRESPYGAANNDLQGIEVENAFGGRIVGNRVIGFAHYGIDIKNNSKRLVVEDNEVIDCETASIIVRPGDAVTNANYQITIRNNSIKNNGYPHAGAVSFNAAIYATAVFQVEIYDNKITGYQYQTVGEGQAIRVTGPGAYLAAQYAANPSQTWAVINNNSITWKDNGISGDTAYPLVTGTPTAIQVDGLIDTVSIIGNQIIDTRQLAVDTRINSAVAGIIVTYDNTTTIGSRTIWPLDVSIKDNTISKFHGSGIRVDGPGKTTESGLNVSNNNVSYCAIEGLSVQNCMNPIVSTNRVVGCGSGSGYSNMVVFQCSKAVVTSNSSSPRTIGGTNAVTYALSIRDCATVVMSGNNFVSGATGTVDSTGTTGLVTTGNI